MCIFEPTVLSSSRRKLVQSPSPLPHVSSGKTPHIISPSRSEESRDACALDAAFPRATVVALDESMVTGDGRQRRRRCVSADGVDGYGRLMKARMFNLSPQWTMGLTGRPTDLNSLE
jgi:hypothetical protein